MAQTEKNTIKTIREQFAENINRVANGNERLMVTRHGKPVAAIISVEDLEFLEKLEHQLDKKAIQEAWEEQGDEPLESYEVLKSELEL